MEELYKLITEETITVMGITRNTSYIFINKESVVRNKQKELEDIQISKAEEYRHETYTIEKLSEQEVQEWIIETKRDISQIKQENISLQEKIQGNKKRIRQKQVLLQYVLDNRENNE